MKRASKIYTALIMVFLFAPIAILLLFSFNESKSLSVFSGFSLKWYAELFQDRSIMNALQVTIAVAVIAAVISTILGTLAAIGIHAMKKRPQRLMMTLTNIPNTMPDIVTGISLMLLFLFTKVERGFVTMVMAHITFNTPYVILSVMPKLKQMNKHSYEAALDLGATPTYALLHVILPEVDGAENEMVLEAKGHRIIGDLRAEGKTVVDAVAAQHLMPEGDLMLHIRAADPDEGGGPPAQCGGDGPGAVVGVCIGVAHIDCLGLLQCKAHLGAVLRAAAHEHDLCLRVALADHIADEHAGGAQPEDDRAGKDLVRSDAAGFLQGAAMPSGRLAEPVGAAQILHALQLEQHAGEGIGEHHLLSKGKL